MATVTIQLHPKSLEREEKGMSGVQGRMGLTG